MLALSVRTALLAATASIALAAGDARAAEPAKYVWSNAPIRGGGFVDGFVFHPSAPGLLYARTDIGGAYRWDGAAKAWIPLQDGLGYGERELMGVLSLALDANDPSRVYLAAGEYTRPWNHAAALLRSSDKGASWERFELPFRLGGNEDGRSTGERLQVDPKDGADLWLGTTHDGLWRSRDRGRSWRQVSGFPAKALTLVQFGGDAIYAGAADPGGLYRSTDGGETWAPVAGAPTGLIPHHIAFDGAGVLYATFADKLGPNGLSQGGVWKYEPSAKRWTEITPVRPGGANAPFGYAGLAVDARHPGTLVVATLDRWRPGDDLYRSTDGGTHWSALSTRSRHNQEKAPWVGVYSEGRDQMGHWMGAVAIDPNDPGHAVYGTGYGLWMTEALTAVDQGATVDWSFEDVGLEETAVLGLESPPAGGHLLAALGDIGGFRFDGFEAATERSYFHPHDGTDRSIDFAGMNPGLVVRTSDAAPTRGFVSRDGGFAWTPLSSTPPGMEGRTAGRLAVSASGRAWLWTPQRMGGFWSADQGKSWTASTGFPHADGQSFLPSADRTGDGVFYVYDQTKGQVLISVDSGKSFQPIGVGLPVQEAWRGARAVRVVPGRLRDLWLALPQGLYHSAEASKPFAKLSAVDEALDVAFGKPAPGKDYPAVYLSGRVAGSGYELFRSDDQGRTWTRINDDARRFGGASQIAADPRVYGRVYLAPEGRGVMVGDIAP